MLKVFLPRILSLKTKGSFNESNYTVCVEHWIGREAIQNTENFTGFETSQLVQRCSHGGPNFPYLRFGCLEALSDSFKNPLLVSLIPEAKELFLITARLLLEFRLLFIDALGKWNAKPFPMPLRPEDFIAGRAETLEVSAQLLPWITTCFAW